MATPRQLTNAPITEAVIDLRVQLRSNVTLENLKALHGKIKAGYPTLSERNQWQSELEIREGQPQPPKLHHLGVNGYLFSSSREEGKQVVQFRLDGFTFSRLKPYTDWNTCRTEAKRLWDVYQSVGVSKITRVATRYINLLNIPLPVRGLEDYITGLPPVPTGNLGLVSFLNRLQVVDQTRDFSAIITHVLQPPTNPTVASILLDIDAFKEANFEDPFDKAWETFDDLQKFKNSLFFNLITDKSAELFQ